VFNSIEVPYVIRDSMLTLPNAFTPTDIKSIVVDF